MPIETVGVDEQSYRVELLPQEVQQLVVVYEEACKKRDDSVTAINALQVEVVIARAAIAHLEQLIESTILSMDPTAKQAATIPADVSSFQFSPGDVHA